MFLNLSIFCIHFKNIQIKGGRYYLQHQFVRNLFHNIFYYAVCSHEKNAFNKSEEEYGILFLCSYFITDESTYIDIWGIFTHFFYYTLNMKVLSTVTYSCLSFQILSLFRIFRKNGIFALTAL